MKILYTATVLSHICQFHLPHMKCLQEQGHIIHVAAHDNLSVKNGLSLKYTDRFIEIPFQRSPKSPDNIRAYKQLKTLIRKEQYDLIICNTPMGGIVTRLAAIGSCAKVVYFSHGFHFFKGASRAAWMIYYPIEKMMAHLCDMIITINEEDFALAKSRFSVRVEHLHGVGVSPERYHPADSYAISVMRKDLNLKDDDFVVLCTGELNENKDQKTLVSAAALLRDKIPNLRVLLAGNGPLEQQLREQIQRLNLEDHVRLLGYRTDLENVVPAADLVVSCSHREGLGLNVIEGMLCGKPVIASMNRGHTELIEDGITGYLVPRSDVSSFADRIYSINSDERSRNQMGRNGLAKAGIYTVDDVRRKFMAIVEEGTK